jgi:hypothetical protein
MADIVLPALVATFIATVVNFIKYVRAADYNGMLTQLVVWAVGIAAVTFAAHSDLLSSWVITGTDIALGATNWVTQFLLGLALSSSASQLREFQKAFDRTDTAAKPELMTGRHPTRP